MGPALLVKAVACAAFPALLVLSGFLNDGERAQLRALRTRGASRRLGRP